jgi:hypothetical protein
MKEDNTQYFNDEWNNIKPSEFIGKYYKYLDNEGKPRNIVLRKKNIEFINNYYKNKDADKYTK